MDARIGSSTEKRQKQLDADPVIVMFEKEDGL